MRALPRWFGVWSPKWGVRTQALGAVTCAQREGLELPGGLDVDARDLPAARIAEEVALTLQETAALLA